MRSGMLLVSVFALAMLALAHPVWALDSVGSDSVRSFPDTARGIHVFNDQLASSMSDSQWEFAATHYAGTQKMSLADADRLRAINPDFLILHYRLGLGLGYRAPGSGCQPTGDWITILEGNDWVREYPAAVQENWFYHYPEGSTIRVYNCDWGWYLMNLDDNAWRNYWQNEVLRQVQANDDDGVFMDSLSVPNYMGYDRYDPSLPALDESFESAWSNRISSWLTWLQSQPIGNYYLIPNVGSWINSRDLTDYGPADGVMVEGFAIEADQSPYPYSDWELQMNRILGLVTQDKVIIGQSYVTGDQERMFTLGTYLLVKGSRTFLNIESSEEPEWYPEYDVPIGAPTQSGGSDITSLYDAASQVYRRAFDNGLVLVNAQDTGGTAVTVNLERTYLLAQTTGGGVISASGISTGTVTYEAVTSVTLPPYSAAVLLNEMPHSTPVSTTTSIISVPSSSSSTSTTAGSSAAIPGFSGEAILLGVIVGLFMVSYTRLRRNRESERS